ncbi:conjugal transfer protein TrbA [Phocoenobacter uteri]|uniref:Conjugal transfer protein TrbA n=2 Tax=Phocoenobacter uteri TaxID=146806 RepID=A0A379DFS7_9PAST|nr:helix-turn-helix transcriptional regulator [Phocoenobacter uteri]SUB76412.1 conjugal transfer protein TrbA [Phocoenobacter uteri]
MPYQELIACNVYAIMQSKNISQNALASKMGVSKSTLSLFMNCKTSPRLEFLSKLAFALDTPLSNLFLPQNLDKQAKYYYINLLANKDTTPETNKTTVIIDLTPEQIRKLQTII